MVSKRYFSDCFLMVFGAVGAFLDYPWMFLVEYLLQQWYLREISFGVSVKYCECNCSYFLNMLYVIMKL